MFFWYFLHMHLPLCFAHMAMYIIFGFLDVPDIYLFIYIYIWYDIAEYCSGRKESPRNSPPQQMVFLISMVKIANL